MFFSFRFHVFSGPHSSDCTGETGETDLFSFHAQIADLLAGDSDDDNDSNDNNDSEDWESVIDGSEPFDTDGSESE